MSDDFNYNPMTSGSIPFYTPTDICSFSNYGIWDDYSSSGYYCHYNQSGWFIQYKTWSYSSDCLGEPTSITTSKCDGVDCVCDSSNTQCDLMTFTSLCNQSSDDTSKYVYKYLANICIIDGSNYYKLQCKSSNGYQITKYSDKQCKYIYVDNNYYGFGEYVSIPVSQCTTGSITATCPASAHTSDNNGDGGNDSSTTDSSLDGNGAASTIISILALIGCISGCGGGIFCCVRAYMDLSRKQVGNSIQFQQLPAKAVKSVPISVETQIESAHDVEEVPLTYNDKE